MLMGSVQPLKLRISGSSNRGQANASKTSSVADSRFLGCRDAHHNLMCFLTDRDIQEGAAFLFAPDHLFDPVSRARVVSERQHESVSVVAS